MRSAWNESPVALDKLDTHLKALLRLKIREFVHLSPWFQNVELVDTLTTHHSPEPVQPFAPRLHPRPVPCPHRKNDGKIGRRVVRGSLHLTGVAR